MLKGVRKATGVLLEQALGARARTLAPAELAHDAWVVAPHPDDETLGCGGTIAEKRQRGARVRVVFVSDGRRSHSRWVDGEQLAARRKAEGQRACDRLGVPSDDVHFLDLPDGDLSAYVERGSASLARLFAESPAEQFFLPHRLEPPPDHAATTAMALDGLRRVQSRGTVFEYPVWMWAMWPWVPRADDPSASETLSRQASVIAKRIGETMSELRWRADVRSQMATKEQALSCHETQMTRPSDAADWPVLADVGDGEFLERFFCGWEYFHRSSAGS